MSHEETDTIDGVKIERLPTYGRPYRIKTRKQGRQMALYSLNDTGIRGKAKGLSKWRKKNHPLFKKDGEQ